MREQKTPALVPLFFFKKDKSKQNQFSKIKHSVFVYLISNAFFSVDSDIDEKRQKCIGLIGVNLFFIQ